MPDQTQEDTEAREPATTTAGRLRNCLVRRFHPLYEPAELARAIDDFKGADGDGWTAEETDFGRSCAPDLAHLTSEDAHRLRVLERIAADSRGHQRRSIIGSPEMVRRITVIRPAKVALSHF